MVGETKTHLGDTPFSVDIEGDCSLVPYTLLLRGTEAACPRGRCPSSRSPARAPRGCPLVEGDVNNVRQVQVVLLGRGKVLVFQTTLCIRNKRGNFDLHVSLERGSSKE